jgi:endonuclease-3
MGKPRTPKGRARETAARLAVEYPGTPRELCALNHDNPFQLLIATILSAQATDERVNLVTPALFARYPTPPDLAGADQSELERLIQSTGFFRSKARSLIGMASAVVERYGGEVPVALEDLVTLPGVGRKTANVIRSVDFDEPGLPVDTHVLRLSRLLGLTTNKDPDKVEADLTAMLPPREWGSLSLRLILHGRKVCIARRPRCEVCLLADFCPSSRVPTVKSRRRIEREHRVTL